VSRAVIFTDQCAPDGRTIRFNIDEGTRAAASKVTTALQSDQLLEIPNEEDGQEPIFVNPERVATITPVKED
jgi:hypothetical protein